MIAAIEGPRQVGARDSADYRCVAIGDGPLAFVWYVTRGRFAWDQGYRVRWYASETSGTDTLVVVVQDSFGRCAVDTLSVRVARWTRVFVSTDGGLKPRGHAYFSDSIREGYLLNGTTWSDTGVTFLFLDSANFALWLRGQRYEWLIRRMAWDTRNFSDTIESTGRYYAVMDNAGNDIERSYRLVLTVTSP
ncbi:MAG: hypothetical protein ABIK43_04955 [candidate division WOR-3 bacterium]